MIDGGRTRRYVERFVAHLRAGVAARSIVRLEGAAGTHVVVLANDQGVGAFDAGDGDDWVERSFDIPADVAAPRTRIEIRVGGGGGPLTTFHYWFAGGSGPR